MGETDFPSWQYREFSQVGTEYDRMAEVEAYDKRMGALRDIPGEIRAMLDAIHIGSESVVMDIGAGTGEFAIAAARECSKVYALDVSEAMLEYARRKAESRGVTNIEYRHAGFLSYEHDGEPLDAVITQLALHHLPDFWKAVALERIHAMLKPGGRLYLKDVVFAFPVERRDAVLNGWIQSAGDSAKETARHISEEFSTLDWVMEGLLQRAGFEILDTQIVGGVLATYLCKRI